MKRYLITLLLLLSMPVMAEPLNLDLQKMKLSDLVPLVYGELLKRSYVVDSSLLSDESLVTINLKNMQLDFIDAEVRKLLDAHGYVADGKTVLNFHKREELKDSIDSLFVYHPVNRPVSYLLDIASSLFKPGSFTFQRRVSGINLAQVAGTSNGQISGTPPNYSGSVIGQGSAMPLQVSEQGLNATADRDVDVIVFHGTPQDIERLKSLLSLVDLPSGEVMVKAVVYEVQTTKSEGSAVDLLASVLSGKFGLKIAGGAASAASSAFLKLPIGKLDLSAVYSAINSDDRFKLLTSPRVRVKSGSSASFSVGNETPVLGAISLDNSGRTTQSVSYMQSGVIFNIAPVVREGGSQLTVSQQISQFITTTTGVNNSPTLTKRELSTQITAHDDEIIMLGGLDEERGSKTDTGLTFLPAWLRSKTNDSQHTEIVLLLHVQRI